MWFITFNKEGSKRYHYYQGQMIVIVDVITISVMHNISLCQVL